MSFRVVIPARMASSRLPGKPLADICGRSMIARVWDVAMASGADDVVVATDSEKISEELSRIGGVAQLTSPSHVSGTDRLAEVARARGFAPDDIVVNLQGDEPCMPPALLATVANVLDNRDDVVMSTVATPIASADELFEPSVVKVVCRADGRACYFSRAPIPWVRDGFSPSARPPSLPAHRFLRHLGLYAYRTSALLALADADPCDMERAESLEQLRALALGMDIHVSVVEVPPPPGVDTPEDLVRMREVFS